MMEGKRFEYFKLNSHKQFIYVICDVYKSLNFPELTAYSTRTWNQMFCSNPFPTTKTLNPFVNISTICFETKTRKYIHM